MTITGAQLSCPKPRTDFSHGTGAGGGARPVSVGMRVGAVVHVVVCAVATAGVARGSKRA
jgi:hypothetical protein